MESVVRASQVLLPPSVRLTHHFIAASDQEYVCGDPHRLRQCLNNFLSNAMKFTSEGSIVVSCQACEERVRVGRKERRYAFSVTDTGMGMSEESLASIFQPFAQVLYSTSMPEKLTT